jgi:very-short-patch-repair endonuclease
MQALDRDAARDAFLRKRGFVVLRSWNNDVLEEIQAVLDRIWAAALLPPPSPRPSPAGAGEGDPSGGNR